MLKLHLLFCCLAVASAVVMLLVRHPMKMALALVATMLNLAIVYGLSGAHVLAIGQVLIYVGAVMIFMIYVVMLLDIKDSSLVRPLSRYLFAAVVVLLLIAGISYHQLANTVTTQTLQAITPVGDMLSFRQFSEHFLEEYWLHFELSSVLLLVTTVAAITVLNFKKGTESL
ncbi:MAG: NADH-quinone oxidoreductase subunit J [Oligoflexia bacterium]|nr:NADH-quinone oxidoreductase subunit J [Oligoflexia bacterium]MBF0366267.1 NADH-quinone oxidoreductase subunit J [Oligoflexia bacterium]